MPHPLLYDVRRTLTSKSVLILMVIMIAFSFAIIPSFTSTGISSSNFANTQVFTYYDSSGGYHFLAFAWNQFGQPVSGITFQANLSLSQPVFSSSGGGTTTSSHIYQTPAGTTNSSGVTQFYASAPLNTSYYVSLSVKHPNGYNSNGFFSQPYITYKPVTTNGTFGQPPSRESIPPGQIVTLLGNGAVTTVTNSKNTSELDIQATWAASFGKVPTNYSIYYKFINVSSSPPCTGGMACTVSESVLPNQLNESSMSFLTNLTTYREIFPPPKLIANITKNAEIAIALFYPNGTSVQQQQTYFPVSVIYPPPPPPITPAQGNSFVIQFFEGLFGIFIPLLAIVGSYNSYGKDRVSGVLESVLAQPVSRKGLSVSRFLSSFIAMAIATSIAVGVVDTIAWYFTKSFVNSTIILSSALAFFVELAVFIATMMLLSHIVRSSGILIGIGIGLFMVIDFFWGIIIGIVANFSNTPFFSNGYYKLVILAEFLNPAQFVGLIDTYLTHEASFVGFSPFNFPITPEAYGITIPAIVATGLLWIALPLGSFLYLAIKRD